MRKIFRHGTERVHPDGAGTSEISEQDEGRAAVGRRALLTRGGVVAAGVVGAGAVAAAVAGPASAAAGDPVLQDTVNAAGTSATPTELDADNNTTPAFILKNTGVDTTTTPNGAGPALRLTPSAETVPTASTVGGDLTTTLGGALWFTHNFSTTATPDIVAAPVHTEATANVYAALEAPSRVLDTRTAAGRANIVNASGNLDSAGRLLAGHTIAINLDGLVFLAEAMFANLTVTGTVGNGYLTVWSGATARPTASSINFGAGVTLSNFVSSGVSEFSTTILNVVGIYASQTTHVILDVAGFTMPGFEYSKVAAESPAVRASRLRRAQQAMRNASRS
jgi:hypothetical protein